MRKRRDEVIRGNVIDRNRERERECGGSDVRKGRKIIVEKRR